MSIATQISRLTTLRDNIRTKLISLGLLSDTSADLEDCYDAIDSIPCVGPVILEQPRDFVGLIGDTATFKVKMAGTGWSYNWYGTLDNGYSWADMSTTSASTPTALTDTFQFPIAGDGLTRQRIFRCKITKGPITVFTNTVKCYAADDTIYITQDAPDETNMLGEEEIAIPIRVAGSPTSYRWYLSTNGGSTWNTTTATGYNTNTIYLTPGSFNTMRRNMYRCTIVKGDATLYSRATSYTFPKIDCITVQPVDTTVAALGDVATFTLTASGVGTLSYRWQYKSLDNPQIHWLDSNSTGNSTATLKVNTSADTVNCVYRCAVYDAGRPQGLDYSNEVYIKVGS